MYFILGFIVGSILCIGIAYFMARNNRKHISNILNLPEDQLQPRLNEWKQQLDSYILQLEEKYNKLNDSSKKELKDIIEKLKDVLGKKN